MLNSSLCLLLRNSERLSPLLFAILLKALWTPVEYWAAFFGLLLTSAGNPRFSASLLRMIFLGSSM